MTVFVVCRVTNPGLIGPAIKSKFPNNYFELQHDEWLISAKGTAREVSDRIGITKGDTAQLGSAIVIGFAGYYGRAPMEVWDWIKAKMEATGG
jgi:hypothetical protein